MGMESGLIHAYQSSPKDRLRSFPPNQVDDCVLLHGHATGLVMGFDRVKDLLAKVVFFQQVSKGQNRGLIWDPLTDQVNAS